MFRKIIMTWPVWFTLPIRLALGGIMFAHGAQKVLGSFGGPGFNAFINNPQAPFSFMRPAWLWWALAAFAEFLGGILIVLWAKRDPRITRTSQGTTGIPSHATF